MKKTITLFAFVLLIPFAQATNQTATDSSKAAFYSAFDALKNMLEGKDSLEYEKAVFITENAYYGNAFKYEGFKLIIDQHLGMINSLIDGARKENEEKYKSLKIYEQKMFKLNIDNWAIFKYITDTVFLFRDSSTLYYRKPFSYTVQDPYGSNQWENTQVLHLLRSDNPSGNCYSLSALFKIFSDRLKSEARFVTTPHHIYIQTRNQRGDFKNVELATKTFPGDGSIQVLTYTTKETIMKGMAQQPLSDKQAIVLNLIYLAKGFQHKFHDDTNDFLLKCADLAFKHDTLSMNALLLKAEVTENRLFYAMRENKISSVGEARANLKTKNLLASYEKQLNNLYKCGYREIPKDIQHIILSAIQGNKDGYITTDKTPNPFASIGEKTRYATLSWGLFDEMHYDVDTIQYFHASLQTKKKKIIDFLPPDTSKNYKVDPVVFAMSVDPAFKIMPDMSPYSAFMNNPVFWTDPEGDCPPCFLIVGLVLISELAIAPTGNPSDAASIAEARRARDIDLVLTVGTAGAGALISKAATAKTLAKTGTSQLVKQTEQQVMKQTEKQLTQQTGKTLVNEGTQQTTKGLVKDIVPKEFVSSNVKRLEQKLGEKIGQGRLPFEKSKAGVQEAIEKVEKTLETATTKTEAFIPKTGAFKGQEVIDIFSKETGFTVRVSAKTQEFVTLIDEATTAVKTAISNTTIK